MEERTCIVAQPVKCIEKKTKNPIVVRLTRFIVSQGSEYTWHESMMIQFRLLLDAYISYDSSDSMHHAVNIVLLTKTYRRVYLIGL